LAFAFKKEQKCAYLVVEPAERLLLRRRKAGRSFSYIAPDDQQQPGRHLAPLLRP